MTYYDFDLLKRSAADYLVSRRYKPFLANATAMQASELWLCSNVAECKAI